MYLKVCICMYSIYKLKKKTFKYSQFDHCTGTKNGYLNNSFLIKLKGKKDKCGMRHKRGIIICLSTSVLSDISTLVLLKVK